LLFKEDANNIRLKFDTFSDYFYIGIDLQRAYIKRNKNTAYISDYIPLEIKLIAHKSAYRHNSLPTLFSIYRAFNLNKYYSVLSL
jgi:hypothetical protein